MDIVELFKKRTRSPLRPRSSDIISNIFPHFRQHPPYKGSLILGETDQWDQRIFVVAQQKPKPHDFRTTNDLEKLNYGMLTAEDHAHILRFLKKTDAWKGKEAVLISLVDTYGADISMESARLFQAFFIARCIKAFLNLQIPSASIVLGEGGSGGALAIQYTDRRAQLEDALYATAPPESMAAIIFRDPTRIGDALNTVRPTADDLKELGVIETIISSPRSVSDVEGFARPIAAYLEKTVKDLAKQKIAKLIEERKARADAFGLAKPKSKKLRNFFPLTPLKKKGEDLPPPDLKIFTVEDSVLQVRFDYGDGLAGPHVKECIKCGDTSRRGDDDEEGCGKVIPLKEYMDNFNVCPYCGCSRVMGAHGWIKCLTDEGTFQELYRDLTVKELLPESLMTPEYEKFVSRQARRTHFRESLVTGLARIFGHKVVLAVCEFYFSGGTMGVVFGEKFHRAADYAIEKRYPLISLCCSGGARLYEGILALMQMVKTINAIDRLKAAGLPYISILGDPSTGGAIASYAALGDVIIAEPEAMVIFTGPRVMKTRGFPVEDRSIRAASLHELSAEIFNRVDFFQEIRGIHEVAARRDMKRVLCKYLEFYGASSARQNGEPV